MFKAWAESPYFFVNAKSVAITLVAGFFFAVMQNSGLPRYESTLITMVAIFFSGIIVGIAAGDNRDGQFETMVITFDAIAIAWLTVVESIEIKLGFIMVMLVLTGLLSVGGASNYETRPFVRAAASLPGLSILVALGIMLSRQLSWVFRAGYRLIVPIITFARRRISGAKAILAGA